MLDKLLGIKIDPKKVDEFVQFCGDNIKQIQMSLSEIAAGTRDRLDVEKQILEQLKKQGPKK